MAECAMAAPEKKTLGVVGLGLIGGSFVKSYEPSEEWQIFGYDVDERINQFAMLAEDIDGVLDEETIGRCDLILLCVTPEAAIGWLAEHADLIAPDAVVIDCCGVKESVCDSCFAIAREHGFTYVGGHPMAGRHYSGYKYATEKLYRGAPMVIVPEVYDDIELLAKVKDLLAPARFGSISVTTAREHDRMIAFTSQLAHVVSNAYVKSPTAEGHDGFSAGSYKDLTRVAWLNEKMWTELFMDNRENLSRELDHLIDRLTEYRDALREEDHERMEQLLAEGVKRKTEIDG
ncbi:MAG: prephenate dehydrogenase/arogenate dehydrogenase family protein [Firmicutes bacterium]|nr:prephenate dehydrogenase/arogenate dehydrogenase family protein [Bacillota bacterium]